MGNENSQANEPNTVVEAARNIIDKIYSIFNSSEEEQVNSDLDAPQIVPSKPIIYPDENWLELFESLPLEILYSIFYYLELNFQSVIRSVLEFCWTQNIYIIYIFYIYSTLLPKYTLF